MVRLNKIYTRTGDQGTTALGNGERRKKSDLRFAAIGEIDEANAVIGLARLIEMKMACGLGSPRRTHRDLADVVELIAIHQLSRSFARFLHKSLRPEFRKLVEQSRG